MSKLGTVIVVAVVMAAVGCSSKKELNNSSAKSFLKESIERDRAGETLLSLDQISKMLTTDWTFEDYRSMVPNGDDSRSLFRRMLDAGYVNQKTLTLSYPDLGGNYKGEAFPIPGIYYGTPKPNHVLYELSVSTQPSSVSVSVHYNYHLWSPSGQELTSSSGDTRGTLGNDVLTINYPYGTLPGGNFKVSSHGNLVDLTGPSPTGEMRLSGQAKGGQITVTKYSYSPSDKLLNSSKVKCHKVEAENCISLGQYVVDDVNQLLLDSAEIAAGRFNWHLELNKLGMLFYPSSDHKTGVGNVQFRKQPDGDWVLVRWSY